MKRRKHEMVGSLVGEVLPVIKKIATTSLTILIQGETGTGKELVAQEIHKHSGREGRFVAINCGAIPEGLIESELFGHKIGAFTGAHRDREGRFELANDGTIFLDEIGDLAKPIQVKLLRVLQEKTFERVGEAEARYTNARVVAATHKNLQEAIRKGDFREDLYYRLQEFEIELRPLRERPTDVKELIYHFLKKHLVHEENRNIPKEGVTVEYNDGQPTIRSGEKEIEVKQDFMEALLRNTYPGNVRELENYIRRAAMLMEDDYVIKKEFLPLRIRTESDGAVERSADTPFEEVVKDMIIMKYGLDGVEMKVIEKTMKHCKGNREDAANLLGIPERTFYRKLDEWRKRLESAGLEVPEYLKRKEKR